MCDLNEEYNRIAAVPSAKFHFHLGMSEGGPKWVNRDLGTYLRCRRTYWMRETIWPAERACLPTIPLLDPECRALKLQAVLRFQKGVLEILYAWLPPFMPEDDKTTPLLFSLMERALDEGRVVSLKDLLATLVEGCGREGCALVTHSMRRMLRQARKSASALTR